MPQEGRALQFWSYLRFVFEMYMRVTDAVQLVCPRKRDTSAVFSFIIMFIALKDPLRIYHEQKYNGQHYSSLQSIDEQCSLFK